MEIVNGLFLAVFLILVAVSVAVTGSMVLLGLIDRAFAKKKKPEPGPEGPTEDGQEDVLEDDDALEHLHAEQMRKFSTR